MSYERLDWDSQFFGLPIGRLSAECLERKALTATIRAADEDGIACLYLLVPIDSPGPLQLAVANGFVPYDIRVELDRPLEGSFDASDDGIRVARPDDLPSLERLARETMKRTRFYADPGFPAELVPELYACWVRRGVETFPARRTFLAGQDDGFITCHFDEAAKVGTIELVGVSRRLAGNGVGPRLVRVANAAFAHAGLRQAKVVTQGANIAAQRLYQKNGYRTRGVALWLHRWAPGSAGTQHLAKRTPQNVRILAKRAKRPVPTGPRGVTTAARAAAGRQTSHGY